MQNYLVAARIEKKEIRIIATGIMHRRAAHLEMNRQIGSHRRVKSHLKITADRALRRKHGISYGHNADHCQQMPVFQRFQTQIPALFDRLLLSGDLGRRSEYTIPKRSFSGHGNFLQIGR